MTYFARQLAFIFVLLAQSGRISVDVNLVVLHAQLGAAPVRVDRPTTGRFEPAATRLQLN